MRRYSLFAALLSLVATPCAALPSGNYLTAMDAYKAGNYEACAADLRRLIAKSPAPYTATYYNAACCLALAGHADEAMTYLNSAVTHPAFREYTNLSRDEDLISLHANPAWPDLLREAKIKSTLGPVIGAGLDTQYVRKHPPKIQWSEATKPFRSHPIVLIVVVEPDGSPGNVTVEQSSGSQVLDRQVVEIARTWRYLPAKADGNPFRMATRIPVVLSAH